MNINQIERYIDGVHSTMNAFPSHGPSIDLHSSAENKLVALDLQFKSHKLLTNQQEKLEKMTEALSSLLEHAQKHQLALYEREKIEDQRF